MKLYEVSLAVLTVALVIVFVVGVVSKRFLGHDNPIEEKCEEIIKEYTGFEMDLTPDSKEAEEDEVERQVQYSESVFIIK